MHNNKLPATVLNAIYTPKWNQKIYQSLLAQVRPFTFMVLTLKLLRKILVPIIRIDFVVWLSLFLSDDYPCRKNQKEQQRTKRSCLIPVWNSFDALLWWFWFYLYNSLFLSGDRDSCRRSQSQRNRRYSIFNMHEIPLPPVSKRCLWVQHSSRAKRPSSQKNFDSLFVERKEKKITVMNIAWARGNSMVDNPKLSNRDNRKVSNNLINFGSYQLFFSSRLLHHLHPYYLFYSFILI